MLKRLLPWLTVVLILIATALQLHRQGRLWICSCGRTLLWTSGAWTSDNSQHWFDPYSITHVLHGLAFCGLLALLIPRVSVAWRFVIAVAAESLWEIVENTNTVIERYRETAALGYQGDSVVNSIGDIFACSVGFWLAWKLGWRRSIVIFVAVELVLLFWIRDSLLLEVIMLIHPLQAIKAWQMSS
jgi:hypothetical protein